MWNITAYKYKFNGQEWQDELGLNLYDMDMRDYDPAIGRWTGIDPVTHHNMSPYVGMDNNPVSIADPSGADGVMGNEPTGNVYGMAGQSSAVHYSNANGTNSSIFWGSSEMLFEQSYEGHFLNSMYTTNDSEEINYIYNYFANLEGFKIPSYVTAGPIQLGYGPDTPADQRAISNGFYYMHLLYLKYR
jgi:RHS repeat-associated protein